MLVRESLEELTLRAEEVRTQKSCINVDHIAEERRGPPLVDAELATDWHALKEKTGRDFNDCYKEVSRAAGVKKPQEAQKNESPVQERSRSQRQHLGEKLFFTPDFYRPAERKIRARTQLPLTVPNAMMELGACMSLLDTPWL